jgi:peptidoglycan-associated lipoprotein
MKFPVWTKYLLVTMLIAVLAGCKSATPKPQLGEGTGIDDSIDQSAIEGEGSMGGTDTGTPEGTRPDLSGGVDYSKWEPIYFEYDSAAIQSQDRGTLEDIAGYLKDHSGQKLLIEGHCDERGTPEYNRTLGQRRANAARDYLIKLGVSPSQISTISYGEEKPEDSGHDEAAWAKNRRDVFGLVK